MRSKQIKRLLTLLLVIAFLVWEIAHKSEDPFSKTTGEAHLFISECDDSLNRVISSAINSAEHSILLYIYSLTDPNIVHALEKKAASNVDVTVIEDPAMFKKHPPLDHVKHLPYNTRGLMHRKILVIDREKVVIGSANFTRDSLYADDNLVATFTSQDLAHLIEKMERGKFSTPTGPLTFYPLPEAKEESFDAMRTLLQTAQKTVRVAMFTLTHPVLIEEMIKANERGVDVEIAVDRKSAEGTSSLAIQRLKEAHVPLILSSGSQTFHHKFLYVDGKVFAFGSANWTKAAFSKNEECILILHEITEEQREKIEKMWHAIRCEGKMVTHVVNKSVTNLLQQKERVKNDFSFQPNRLTQLLFGERVEMLSNEGEFCLVHALEQPHFTEERGWHFYTGYLLKEDLNPIKVDLPPTHAVTKRWSHLSSMPLAFGTLLHLKGETVHLPDGTFDTINSADIRPVKSLFSRETLLSDAALFLGEPYLWGGRGESVDCSALVNLLYRVQGIFIPRDAHPQSLKCKHLRKENLKSGDLVYLTPTHKQNVTHVVLYKDKETFLESPKTGQFVREFSIKDIEEKEGIWSIKGREFPYRPLFGSFV